MQAPPPTTFDPEFQRRFAHDLDRGMQRSFDTAFDLTRILVVLVGVAAILFIIVVILVFAAQWRRAQADAKLQDAGDLPGLSR